MVLSPNQAFQLIQKPKNGQALNNAIAHQNRLKMHSVPGLTESAVGPALGIFKQWVQGILPADAYATFQTLLTYPLSTVSLTDDIYTTLAKVWDGRNPSYTVSMMNREAEMDWLYYRQKAINSTWRQNVDRAIRTSINSILVIDLPAMQTGDKPEPYIVWLDITSIIDIEYSSKIEYLIYRTAPGGYVVLDDASYLYFDDVNGRPAETPSIQAPHDLGYCPASFFWSEYMPGQPITRVSPLTRELANLDWLLFAETSKRHLELYAPYPIYWTIEQECDYKGTDGTICRGGKLFTNNGQLLANEKGQPMRCPNCGASKLTGPGTIIEIPAPRQGEPEIKTPVGKLDVDKNSLEYNRENVKATAKAIKEAVTGFGAGKENEAAYNEKQIAASFEMRKAAIMRMKRNIEAIQIWVESTMCRLRDGEDFNSISLSMGDEFYLFTLQELYLLYAEAKKSGVNQAMLDTIYSKIIETEYRNNEAELERAKMLFELEPLRHYTQAEIMAWGAIVSQEDIYVKARFSELVSRFERENTTITEFGVNLPYPKRIDLIKTNIYNYAKADRTAAS